MQIATHLGLRRRGHLHAAGMQPATLRALRARVRMLPVLPHRRLQRAAARREGRLELGCLLLAAPDLRSSWQVQRLHARYTSAHSLSLLLLQACGKVKVTISNLQAQTL